MSGKKPQTHQSSSTSNPFQPNPHSTIVYPTSIITPSSPKTLSPSDHVYPLQNFPSQSAPIPKRSVPWASNQPSPSKPKHPAVGKHANRFNPAPKSADISIFFKPDRSALHDDSPSLTEHPYSFINNIPKPNVASPPHKSYTIGGVPVLFPFEPYPSQMGMMSKIISALNSGSNALLESPTGSGKSLAILCAALAWRNLEKKRRASAHELATIQYNSDITAWRLSRKNHASKPATAARPEHVELVMDGNTSDDDFMTLNYCSLTVKKPSAVHWDVPNIPSLPGSHSERTSTCSQPPDSYQPTDTGDPPKAPVWRSVPKIYVASRTHRQLTQLIAELDKNTNYRPKMAVLGSRTQYCVLPSITKLGSSVDRNAACAEALETNKCRFYDNSHTLKRVMQVEMRECVWDVDALKEIGLKYRGCPYFTSRALAEEAEIIFCPYNYLIDPQIRATMSINLENAIVVLDEAHNVEDVCRDAASMEVDNAALNVFKQELESLIVFFATIPPDELNIYVHGVPSYQVVLDLVHAVQSFMQESACNWQDINFERKLNVLNTNLLIAHLATYEITPASLPSIHKVFQALGDAASDKRNDPRILTLTDLTLRTLSQLFMALVNVLDPRYAHDFHVIVIERVSRPHGAMGSRRSDKQAGPGTSVGKKNGKITDFVKMEWTHQLAIWCMNPAVVFREISDATHSIILTSGTLSPMNSFASELGTLFPLRLEANHVISHDQSLVGVVCTHNGTQLVGTYQGSERVEYQDSIGHSIIEIARHTPHGVLIFVPSYAFLDKLLTRWKSTGCYDLITHAKPVVLTEPRGNKDGGLDSVLSQYYNAVDQSVALARRLGTAADQIPMGSGAILFGVFRGKVSEGIDFANDWARAVVCIGIPYPNSMDKQVQLKKSFNDTYKTRRGLLSGSEWYDIQAFRALNQALGRCIRHRHDWGMLILLEQRMANPVYQMQVSKWVRPRIHVWPNMEVAAWNIGHFVCNRGAQFVEACENHVVSGVKLE